jgi:hypothetical protein
MNRSVKVCLQWLENLSLIRAIFHVQFRQGGSLPFLGNFI